MYGRLHANLCKNVATADLDALLGGVSINDGQEKGVI